MSDFTITQCDPRADDAVACLTSFFAELSSRLKGGFDVHLSADPDATDMMAPKGSFYVIYDGTTPVGCGGLKGHGDWGEVKRIWISPEARGHGLARRLMERIEADGRALSMTHLRLDTNSQLPEAVALYQRLGWHEIPRFNEDPYPDHFFEKAL